MNKLRKQTIVVLAVALALLSGVLPVAASITVQEQTEANISFESSVGPTKPVDPDTPSEFLDPEDDEDAVEGSLVIVYVTDLAFSPANVSTTTQYSDLQVGNRPHIQMVDLRGSGTGWYLNLSISAFQDEYGAASLRGAKLHMRSGRLISTSTSVTPPTPSSNVSLDTDNTAKNILTANPETNAGMGLWVDRFYPETQQAAALVQLEIPGGSGTRGAHTATLTWTLSDTP